MTYVLKGKLCGYICAECPEDLSGVKVRLYSVAVEGVVARAVANPKETFAVLESKQADGKKKLLLGEGDTDGEGAFEIELDRGYEGGPVEVDVYCATVPHRKPGRRETKPIQFSVTTIQPQWRELEDRTVAIWKYCIPWRFWCAIRARFDCWTICGRVTVCGATEPMSNVRVLAFDTDWLQDDDLGSGVTDANGRFRIDYTSDDFKNLFGWTNPLGELFGGPDLYFRVETLGGQVLLREDASEGRTPARENAGPCFCVELCVPREGTKPLDGEALSVFRSVGVYRFVTDINAASGLTVSGGYGFYSGLRLNGVLAKRLAGQPLEYQFQWAETDAAGSTPPAAAWQRVMPAQIGETRIGDVVRWAPIDEFDENPVKTLYSYYVNNSAAGPDRRDVSITADGWFQVPQESDKFSPTGTFEATNDMIVLRTDRLFAWPPIDLPTLLAGQDSTSTGQPLAQDRHIAVRMWVREAGNDATKQLAGTCRHLAVDNTHYTNLSHHPEWNGHVDASAIGVGLLDIQELIGHGCQKITDTLTVLFTAAHPNLGGVSIDMSGPSGTVGFTFDTPPVPGQHFGTATVVLPPGQTVHDLPPCAYVVHFSVGILLTNGEAGGGIGSLWDEIAFCK